MTATGSADERHSEVREALARCRGPAVALFGFGFVINLMSFAGPIFSLQVFDRVLNSQSETTLVLLLAIVLFVVALQAFLEGVRSRVLVRIGVRFDDAIASQTFSRLVRAGITAPRDHAYANAIRDLDQLRECVAGPPVLALFDGPWIPLYLATCFLFHPLIGWTVVASGLVLAGLAWLNGMASRTATQHGHAAAVAASSSAAAAHAYAEAVQALGMTANLRARWAASRDASLAWQAQAGDRAATTTAASRFMRLAVPVVTTAVGGWLVIHGEITPGVLIASSILASRALVPIDQIVLSWRGLQAARGAWTRLSTLEREFGRKLDRLPLPKPYGRVDVSRLFAVNTGGSHPALRNVSFSLEPGEALGVIGGSGSGKSTLARALVGLLAPFSGEVRLDGARLDQWDPERLGQGLGYLPQDPSLFAGTVAQNIARLRPDISGEAVFAAARAAGVHEAILALPLGYDTVLGDGGQGVSGGQRQRIAMARALYGDPSLVVLDEPNSALDGAGESALVSALKTLKDQDCTVVIMTHRLSVLTAVDKLLVLDHGQVRAFGPRDQVIATINIEAAAVTDGRSRPSIVQGGRA